MNDDLLTYPEAARLAGVSLVTIKRAVRDGRLPVVRTSVPRRAYIPRKALEAALRARPQ